MVLNSFVLGIATGLALAAVFIAFKNHAKSRCLYCNRMLKGIVIAHKGGLFCCKICAIEVARAGDNTYVDNKTVIAECEEININDIGG
jgi:ribosomal protein L37AE/L43A